MTLLEHGDYSTELCFVVEIYLNLDIVKVENNGQSSNTWRLN